MEDIYTKVILKLIELTIKEKMNWEKFKPTNVDPFTIKYASKYKEEYFVISSRGSKFLHDIKLEIASNSLETEINFPDNPRINDLWKIIKKKERKEKKDIPKTIQDFLDDKF